MRHWFLVLAVVLLVFSSIGCADESTDRNETAQWKKVDAGDLPPKLSARLDRARRARKALGKTLFGRLSEVMSREGPRAAVDVCNVEAQGMTHDVGEQYNVAIGRTSFRLRNPKNTPPEWARELNLVDNRVEERTVVRRGEQLAVFTPIHLAGKCMTCHGPKDVIPDGVRAELRERYPEDEATGFEIGDLRGWFWVEVPAKKS